jgi:hypothetical protein
VNHSAYAGYFATADVQLADGRHVSASLTDYYGANHSASSGFLSLQVQQPCGVVPPGGMCPPSASGAAELSGDQLQIDRGLRGASAENVSLMLTTPAYYVWGAGVPGAFPTMGDVPPLGPPPFPPAQYTPPVLVPATTEVVTVSIEFTGTGTVSRDAQHTFAEYCGADSTGCQSTHVGAVRTADVTVTVGWASGGASSVSGSGLLTYDQSVDVDTPQPTGH